MTTINRSTGLFVAVLVIPLVFTGTTYAAGGEVTGTTGQVSSASTDNTGQQANGYEYVVDAGESLSLLARDAIQRFAGAKSTELSPAQRVYCETTIAQQMGGRLLEIGEHVVIPFTQLQQCIDASKNLTPQQIAAWQAYTYQTDLNIEGGPEPTNPQADAANTQSESDSDESGEGESDNKDENASTDNEKESATDTNDEAIAWYWWILALSVVGVVFYLLRDKPSNDTESATARKADKTAKTTKRKK